MSLTREDKLWLSKLANLLLRGIVEALIGTFKTEIAVERGKDILVFGNTDKSLYL